VSLLAGDDPFGAGGGDHAHTSTSAGIERVGLPPTYYSDGPVGPRQGRTTALPIPMALAATFDRALARAHGEVVANEARSKGNDVIFARRAFAAPRSAACPPAESRAPGGEPRYWMSTGAPTGTRLNRSTTSGTCMRMQPCDAREPIE
jgi:hypothetical protein